MAKSTLKGAKKATKYRAREADKEKGFDVKQSRLKQQMNTYEDTMGGDEDQCEYNSELACAHLRGSWLIFKRVHIVHMNRDKMLLDEGGYDQNQGGKLKASR